MTLKPVDVTNSTFKANPFPFYAQLRAEAPVFPVTLHGLFPSLSVCACKRRVYETARVMPTNSCVTYRHKARSAYPLDKQANLTTRMASAAVAQLFPAKVVFVLTDSVRSKMHGE